MVAVLLGNYLGEDTQMGWKLLKEKFNINRHYVQVTTKGICIGSGYVHDLAVINPTTGKIHEHETFSNFLREVYPALNAATPAELVRLIEAPDTFSASIPVYTYSGGAILELACESLGWPNVTHDGQMMYDNTFSNDKAKVIAWAKRNAALAVEHARDSIQEAEQELVRLKARLAEFEANEAQLNHTYPSSHATLNLLS